MSMKYKAIIFDFFDVIHSDPYHAWLHNHGLKDEGEQSEINKAVDLDQITMQEHYIGLGKITGQTGTEVEAEFEAAASVDHEVVALLAELKQQFAVALVSNAPSEFLRDIIARHGLQRYFDHVVISGEVGYSKPSPEIFHHILDKLQVRPEEAVFIDDSPSNVTAAEKLGITGIVHTDAGSLQKSLMDLGISVRA